MVGHACLDRRDLLGLSLGQVLERLRTEHRIDPYRDFPPSAIYGTFMKKRLVPHVGLNPRTGQSMATVRARIEARSFDWVGGDELDRARLVLDRHWEEHHPATLELIELDPSKSK